MAVTREQVVEYLSKLQAVDIAELAQEACNKSWAQRHILINTRIVYTGYSSTRLHAIQFFRNELSMGIKASAEWADRTDHPVLPFGAALDDAYYRNRVLTQANIYGVEYRLEFDRVPDPNHRPPLFAWTVTG